MAHPLAALLLAGLLVGPLAGCTTYITTHPTARIYVDGELVGIGQADIGRVGPPREAVVRVEHEGAMVERTIERDFEVTTVFFGLISAYTGLFWGWSFPEHVHIELPLTQENPWLRPRSKPATAPAADPWAAPDT